MGTHQASSLAGTEADRFPGTAELAALRAWYAGLTARQAVERYLGNRKSPGQSSRAMLTAIRRRLARFARSRQRDALAELFERPAEERGGQARAVAHAIETLRCLPAPAPLVTDAVERWLPRRAVAALRQQGIRTLADLTVRVPRRRRWWTSVPGLGARTARRIEGFFAEHPELTERARALVVVPSTDMTPWEHLVLPVHVDGSKGVFRAPRATCVLAADNDYAAVQAWLALQESPATQRACRKEAERLMLWAILERKKALSSLTTEDAIAYRAFLRRPTPRGRWLGPARPRTSNEWWPFQGTLSAPSVAYALSVIGAMYRWLIEQRYLLANPFSGIKGKGGKRTNPLDAERGFSEQEWPLVRSLADCIEWTSGWSEEGAQRLRFVLDFWYATGLRPQECADARLGHLKRDDHGNDWLTVVGKGGKKAEVAVPHFPLAALERYLVQRGLPVTRSRWDPATPLIPRVVRTHILLDKGKASRICRARFGRREDRSWHAKHRHWVEHLMPYGRCFTVREPTAPGRGCAKAAS